MRKCKMDKLTQVNYMEANELPKNFVKSMGINLGNVKLVAVELYDNGKYAKIVPINNGIVSYIQGLNK